MEKESNGGNMLSQALLRKTVGIANRYITLSGLLALVLVSSLLSDAFLTLPNLFNIIRQITILGFMSLGMTLVILSGGIDLSVGAILALSAVGSAQLILETDISPYMVILIMVVAGGLVGFCNGIIIAKGEAEPFLVTLGMHIILRGVAFIICNARTLPLGDNTPPMIRFIANGFIGPVPMPVILIGVFYLILALIVYHTVFGRYIYALGGNAEVVRLAGISVVWMKIKVYTLSGMLSAMAGIIHISRINAGDPTAGDLKVLPVIAAVIIGGTRFIGGVGNVVYTVIGLLIVGIINNILNLLGAVYYIQMIAQGITVILAVIISTVTARR
jgi:ribose/xylose/arabinose/galactoside ABC-type transport system permease subunit